MVNEIRKFALIIIDDFDKEIDRFNLDYADTPKNLGFEIEFTTIESRLTTHFTSAREKKLATTLNLNFVPPNAYLKAHLFKQFVQKYMHSRMVFEYSDTVDVKNWEGKIQKFGQEELLDWGGLVCPISFLPATPKYIKKDNTISVEMSSVGRSYPFKYPYSYGKTIIENNGINNIYFDEVPVRVTIYGRVANPHIGLSRISKDGHPEVYTSVRFDNLIIQEGEHLLIDAISSKVLLWRNNEYISAYDYISKQPDLDTFLYAQGNTFSEVIIQLGPQDTGHLVTSYRQYTL